VYDKHLHTDHIVSYLPIYVFFDKLNNFYSYILILQEQTILEDSFWLSTKSDLFIQIFHKTIKKEIAPALCKCKYISNRVKLTIKTNIHILLNPYNTMNQAYHCFTTTFEVSQLIFHHS